MRHPGWLYYILDGLAKVYVATSDGGEQIVEFMRQDTLIGMDCIDIENKSVVSIASVTEMHVLPFTPDILRKMIFQDPELGFDLVSTTGKSCGRWPLWWAAWGTPTRWCGWPRFCPFWWTPPNTGKRGASP